MKSDMKNKLAIVTSGGVEVLLFCRGFMCDS